MCVLIEGPYGHALSLKDFAHVLFIAGGSGVTVPVSQLSKLSHEKVSLVWAVRQRALFEDVYARELRGAGVKIHLHVTGPEAQGLKKGWAESVVARPGRPDVGAVIADSVEAGGVLGRGRTAVVVCGPRGMIDEARYALVKAMDADRNLDVQFFEESFSW